MKQLIDPDGTLIYYLGMGPEAGPLPAFIYFSLAGDESLQLEPYNTPAAALANAPMRTFSFTLPGHGEGFDKYCAMHYWAEQMREGNYLLEAFFQAVHKAINWLIETKMIDPNHLAVGGLSRGAFVATHIAAREIRIKTVLGLAPLTCLSAVSEFEPCQRQAEELNLDHLIDNLTHLNHLRFYIANHDTRVDTDACYHFVRGLAKKVQEKHARHCHIELFLTHPIGAKGHGTSNKTFLAGSEWIKEGLGIKDEED